jgi:hypothetical protein
MATLKQIEANRLNSQKSTGPSSLAGRAAVRFNALKSGIDAQSQVIPGEDPAALALLTAEYHDRYQPATPEVRALVDTLVTAEWMQRRFRTLEAQLFQLNITRLFREEKGLQAAQVYERDSDTFERLQRRINAVERSFHRALATLQKIESSAPQPGECSGPPSPDPRPKAPGSAAEASQPPAPDPPSDQPLTPEIGFDPSTPPKPIDSVVVQPDPIHEIPIRGTLQSESQPKC